jgi:hypothetical protein
MNRQEQRSDDFVAAATRFQPTRDRTPNRTGDRASDERIQPSERAGQMIGASVERGRGAEQSTDADLSFAADVGEIRALRQHEAEPD